MNRRLLIIGAGQYGRLVKEIAEVTREYVTIGFLDDNAVDAIGTIADMKKFAEEYQHAVVALGNSKLRMKLIYELEACGYKVITLIHPKAYVSPSAKIGKGCIVEPLAVIQTEVILGDGVLMSSGTVINHNSKIEQGCHLDVGSIIPARSVVTSDTKINAGEVYKDGEA